MDLMSQLMKKYNIAGPGGDYQPGPQATPEELETAVHGYQGGGYGGQVDLMQSLTEKYLSPGAAGRKPEGPKPEAPRQETPEKPAAFYDRPEFWGEADTWDQKIRGLEQELKKYQTMAETARGPAGALYGSNKAAGEFAKAELEKVQKAYRDAVKGREAYNREQGEAYLAWKDTIRDAAEVDEELAQVEQQIREQQKKDAQEATNSDNWMAALGYALSDGVSLGAGAIGGAGEREKPSRGMQALEERKRLLKEEKNWSEYFRYQDLTDREDFAEKSRYTRQDGKTLEGKRYNLVNKDPETMAVKHIDPRTGEPYYTQQDTSMPAISMQLGSKPGLIQSTGEMTDQEIGIYNYLYSTDGPEMAEQYLKWLQTDLHARQRAEAEKQAAAIAREHPVLATAQNILRSPLAGAAYVGQTIDMMADGEVDQNAWYNRWNQEANAMTQAVSDEVGKKWGPVGSFAYQTGMSMGQFLMNTAITGGSSALTLALMGSGAAANATVEAKDRGLSDGKAYALGTIAGLAEIVTEKVSLETLLNPKLLANGSLKYIFKNMLAEGSEEAASDAINLFADVLISRDQSQWNQSIEAYMAKGMSKEDAFLQAVQDQALAMGVDFAGGALSGGIMGAGGAVMTNFEMAKQGKSMRAAGITNEDVVANAIASTKSQDEGVRKISGKIVEKAAEAQKAGQPVELSNREVGQLAQAHAQYQQEQEAGDRKSFGDVILDQVTGQNKPLDEKAGDIVTTEDGVEITQGQKDLADRLSKATGREIVYTNAPENVNGWFQDGKIHVNPQSKNPVAQIVGHELTHSVELSESYGDLARIIKSRYGENLTNIRQQKLQDYEAAGIPLSTMEEIDSEIVAEYVEKNLLTNEKEINRMVRDNPGIGQRILNWIDGKLAKLGFKGAEERIFLRRARSYYASALRQSQKNEAAGGRGDGQTSSKVTEITGTEAKANVREQLEERKRQAFDDFDDGKISEEELDRALDAIEEDESRMGLGEKVKFSAEASGKDSEGKYADNKMPTRNPDIRYSVSGPRSDSRRELVGWMDQAFYTGAISEEEYDRAKRILDDTPDEKLRYYQLPKAVADYIRDDEQKRREALAQREGRQQPAPKEQPKEQPKETPTNAQRQQDLEGVRQSLEFARNGLADGSFTEETYEQLRDHAVDYIKKNYPEAEGNARKELLEWAKSAHESGLLDDMTFERLAEEWGEPKPQAVTRDQLSRKGQDYLAKTERKLAAGIQKALGIDKLRDVKGVREIVTDFADTYLATGRMDQEVMDRLFDRVYENGVQLDKEFYDTYKEVKDHLRTTGITISEEDSHDIADYKDWKKGTRGKLRIVNEGGVPVDSFWVSLHDMAPELFPESITHPADQLQKMLEVANSIQVAERTMEDVYGGDADMSRRIARNEFDREIGKYIQDLRNVRRRGEDEAFREEQRRLEVPTDLKELQKIHEGIKPARRKYEKAMNRNLLTASDERKVGELLAGRMSPEELDPLKDNVRGILDVWEAKKEYYQLVRVWKAYQDQVRGGYRKEADNLLKDANEWTDKSKGWALSRETMERNIRDIVKDKEAAEALIKTYIEPVAMANSASNTMKNQYRARVKGIMSELTGIQNGDKAVDAARTVAPGNEESLAYAVQFLGEAMDNIEYLQASRGKKLTRDGKTAEEWAGEIADFWRANPNMDAKAIETAVESFRAIYNELFEEMNRVRLENGYEAIGYRRGYFPHFQKEDEEGLMASFGRALGMSTAVDTLPTSINGLTHTFRPGIVWNRNALERVGFDTVYDALEGFDQYIEGAGNMIYQTTNIQKLRALAAQIRYRTTDDGIREQIDAIDADPDLDEDSKRLKKEEIWEHGRYTLSNFVNELEEYTNILAGKKSKLDRTVEALMGRRVYTFMKNWEQRVGANMVAGNLASAATNVIPLTQAMGHMPVKTVFQGMLDTMQNYRENDGLMGSSDFIINRKGSEALVKTRGEKVAQWFGKPMDIIDGFVSESIVRAAYRDFQAKGLPDSEALHQADLLAARIMADRSPGAQPTLHASRNPLIKAATQFQLEVNNQFSEIFKDLPREYADQGKKALGLALFKYFVGAWLLDDLFEKIFGRRPFLDPIAMLNDFVGTSTGYKMDNVFDILTFQPDFTVERRGLGQAAKDLAGDAVGQLPYTAALNMIGINVDGGRLPAAAAIPDLTNLWDAATEPGLSWKKRGSMAAQELEKPLAYIIPPFGGGQALKTAKGLKAFIQGGSYKIDKDGQKLLQYPVYHDNIMEGFGNALLSGMMGKNATGSAREWRDEGYRTLSAEYTRTYDEMIEAGMSQHEAFDTITELDRMQNTEGGPSKSRQQVDYLAGKEMPGEAKAAAYFGTLTKDGDKDRDLMEQMLDMGADMGTVTDVLLKMRQAGYLEKGESTAQRQALLDAALTDEEKITMYREKISNTRDADILAYQQAGLDMDDFLRSQNEYTRIKAEEEGAGRQALEFSRWVEKQSWDANQEATARESFAYFQMMPAKAQRYEKFLTAGISEESAYKVADILDGVKDDDGYGTKKQKAIVTSGIPEADQMKALQATVKETYYERFEVARSYGISPREYVDAKERILAYGGGSSLSKDEVAQALNTGGSMMESLMGGGLSNAEKAVVWQLWNKSWKGSSNPFDTKIGQQIYEQMHPKS